MAETKTKATPDPELEQLEAEALDEVEETEEAEESAMTPKVLAEELDISPKSLRAFLRREFPRSAQEKNTSWKLTEAQVTAARSHFTPSDEDEESDEDE